MINQVEDSSLKQQFLIQLYNMIKQSNESDHKTKPFIRTNFQEVLESVQKSQDPHEINQQDIRHEIKYLKTELANLKNENQDIKAHLHKLDQQVLVTTL